MSVADLQAARDADYTAAYRCWLASLPANERARLAEQGLAEPDASRQTSTREHDDLILSIIPASEPPPDKLAAAADESAASGDLAITPASSPSISAADVLASFCARIRAHPNPLLAFDAACYASGLMDVEGLSESALAKRHGVTRAAFSKLAVQWSQTFSLPPSRGMRSTRARQSYRKARLNYLARSHPFHAD